MFTPSLKQQVILCLVWSIATIMDLLFLWKKGYLSSLWPVLTGCKYFYVVLYIACKPDNFLISWRLLSSQQVSHMFTDSLMLMNFKSELLVGHPAVARRILWNGICPSFRPSFRLFGRFLWIVSLAFSKFRHGTKNPNEVVRDRAEFSKKILFYPKNWKNGPKMYQKQGFLNLL